MQRHTNTVFMCSQDLWLMREREREKKLSVIVILILKYSLKYIWINPSIWNKVLILYLKKREKKSVWAYLLKYLMFHKTWFRWLMIKFGRQVRKFVLKNFNFKRFASCVKSIWIYIYIYKYKFLSSIRDQMKTANHPSISFV